MFEGQTVNAIAEVIDPALAGNDGVCADAEWSIDRVVSERAARAAAVTATGVVPMHSLGVEHQRQVGLPFLGSATAVAAAGALPPRPAVGALTELAMPGVPDATHNVGASNVATVLPEVSEASVAPSTTATSAWSPTRLFGAMRDVVQTTVFQALERLLPRGRQAATDTTASAPLAAPAVAAPETVPPQPQEATRTGLDLLILEPDLDKPYGLSERTYVAGIAQRFAEPRRRDIPERLNWHDRFMLTYGANGGPPLWLAAKRYQDICEIWGMEASRTCMTGFCMTDTVLPSSFSSISFLADKKGRGNPQFISQTLKLARHLLPFVKERLASDSSLTLSAAVVAAEAEQLAAFRAKSLNNLHDICSASDGGLGKKRRRGVPGGRGEGAGDED